MKFLRDSFCLSVVFSSRQRLDIFFLLSFVTRFAYDIGQSAKISIWVSSEVITISGIYWMIGRLTCYFITLLHRAYETQQGRHTGPRLQLLAFSLDSIMSF